MPILNEGRYPGECIVSEAQGTYSRENIVIASGAGIVGPNRVLGQITASGKYVPVNPAANDGSQTASAVNYSRVDATSADAVGVGLVRHLEVNDTALDYGTMTAPQIATVKTQLAAVRIFVRSGV